MPNKSKKRRSPSDDEGDAYASKKLKKGESSEEAGSSRAPAGAKKDADGNEYWEMSGLRRITVSKFNGKQMISIREYYEKGGETLPGKKGISMPIAQFSTFISLLPQIETVLREKGVTLPRSAYDSAEPAAMDPESEPEAAPSKKESKRNFEETSEED